MHKPCTLDEATTTWHTAPTPDGRLQVVAVTYENGARATKIQRAAGQTFSVECTENGVENYIHSVHSWREAVYAARRWVLDL